MFRSLPAPSSAVSGRQFSSSFSGKPARRHFSHPSPCPSAAASTMVPRQSLRCNKERRWCPQRQLHCAQLRPTRLRDISVRAKADRNAKTEQPVLLPGDRMLSFNVTVRKGDSLDNMAKSLGLPRDILLKANQGRSKVKEGDVLRVAVATKDASKASQVAWQLDGGAAGGEAPARLLHSPTAHLDRLRNAFDGRGSNEQRGWGRSRGSAATEEARLGGGGRAVDSPQQAQDGGARSPALQNAMDTAGYFAGAAGRVSAYALVIAVPVVAVAFTLLALKSFFLAHQEVRAKDEASRKVAEKVLGKAAVEDILRGQQTPAAASAAGSTTEAGASGGDGGDAAASGASDDATNASRVAEEAAGAAGVGTQPAGLSGVAQVPAPDWLDAAAAWAVMELSSQRLMSITLLSKDHCLVLFQGGDDAQSFCDMMNEEGAPPLAAYPLPPLHALGSAAREGKGVAFLPQGAIQFEGDSAMADPDELLVSFCEQSRVLGVTSAASLYSDLRGRQTSEERVAEDASVALAREAAVARENGANSIPADADEPPVFSPSSSPKREQPPLESLLSRVKRSPDGPPQPTAASVSGGSSVGSDNSNSNGNGNGAGPAKRESRERGWWAALPYVCVPLLVYRDEDALAYVTADLAPPGARSERHLLAFEDRRDAGAVQALFAVRSPPDAGVQVQVQPMSPAQLREEAAEQSCEITVFSAGQLRLDPTRHEIEDIGRLAYEAVQAGGGT